MNSFIRRRQNLRQVLRSMPTAKFKTRKKNFAFHLNELFMKKNKFGYCTHVYQSKKEYDDCSKRFVRLNPDYNIKQNEFNKCDRFFF